MKIESLFQQNETPTINEYLRRCDVVDVDSYLNPPASFVEPFNNYDNIDDGVNVLEQAIYGANINDKTIILICDSDCDGYCASTIAYKFLLSEDVSPVNIEVLFHSGKQHGLSKEMMQKISYYTSNDYDSEVGLVWLPDAGTNDVDACSYLKNVLDIPVLVTDHHEASEDNMYATIINNQTSRGVKNKQLCGAGVTHKLITAFCKKHDSKFHQSCLDFVALATIGDVCDMRYNENRMIVKWGLEHINNPTLRVMCDEFVSNADITPTTLAWNVIPKINAVCRSNNESLKEQLFGMLALGDALSNSVDDFIKKLKEQHAEQRKETNKIYEDVLAHGYIGDKVKIFRSPNTPYTGLVATKLSDKYQCPCIVVHGEDFLSGSVRSPVPIRSQLLGCQYVTFCAGHEQSCGIGWYSENTDQLSTFCRQLDLEEPTKHVTYATDNVFIPPEIFDMNDAGKMLWGHGIPEPTIYFSDITISGEDIKELGAGKTTIKFLYGDITFIMFFVSKEKKDLLNVGAGVIMNIDVIGKPSINEFRGKKTKQIVVEEFEVKTS